MSGISDRTSKKQGLWRPLEQMRADDTEPWPDNWALQWTRFENAFKDRRSMLAELDRVTAERNEAFAEAASWRDSCTGKHGSQQPCVSPSWQPQARVVSADRLSLIRKTLANQKGGVTSLRCDWSHADDIEWLLTEIERLSEASPASETNCWQPIETAPQDGRTLLLGRYNGAGKWRTLRGQWFTEGSMDEWDGDDYDNNPAGWYETCVENDDPPNCWPTEPTHWMPLPSAPGTAPTVTGGGPAEAGLSPLKASAPHIHQWVDGNDPEQQICLWCESTRMTPESSQNGNGEPR